MQKSIIETLVGAIVLALCILFVFVIYRSGNVDKGYSAGYVLKAAFEKADGINIGSNVSVSGVNIGKVIAKELDLSNYSAVISMQIDQKVKLPTDTSAEVTSISLLGDKYLTLIPGAETDILKDGDTIEFTQSSISLESIIGKLMFGLNSQHNDNINNSKTEITNST